MTNTNPNTTTEGGWMPIATAPKDGAILGYMPNRIKQGRPYMAVIYWDDELKAEWDFDADCVSYRAAWCAGRVTSFSFEEYAEEHPTHWMPLPAAPVSA